MSKSYIIDALHLHLKARSIIFKKLAHAIFTIFGFCTLLASCGSNIDPVTGITADGLRYTGSVGIVTLHLTGDALTASGFHAYANGTECTKDNSTSETSRVANCIITIPTTLKVDVRVTNSSGDQIYTTSFTVPTPQVTVVTTMGTFVLEFNPEKAPITVNNFLSYVNKSPSFYNNTIFHRVIQNFVVQGGGFTAGMTAVTGQGSAITLESNNGLSNDRGTVAMARTSAPNSATSQFYINVVNNPSLNYDQTLGTANGYAVFGKVISGMDVIDNISAQPTTTVSGNANVPVTDITVTSSSQTQ
jgi:cyclophilin family peptidyl-prolyl cis-trans isomerase